MDDDSRYKAAWDKLYAKLKSFTEITSFHGLQFKGPRLVNVEILLEFMDECLGGDDSDAE